MKKLHAKLSLDQRADALKQAMASPNAKPGRYADTRNVYLKVSKTGAKSWVFMWQADGVQRECGLGSFTGAGATLAVKTTKQAQAAADKVRAMLGTGIDPIVVKRKDKVVVVTFRSLMEQVIADVVAPKSKKESARAKNTQQWRNSLLKHAALIIDRNVTDATITVEDMLTILRPIWAKRKVGNEVRSRIEAVLGAAKSKKLVSENVARWKDNLDGLLAPKQKKADAVRHASLHFNKLPTLVRQLADIEAMDAKALLNAILSGGRTDETLSMRHAELDLDNVDGPRWNIPADRMKAHKAHTVMLSTQHANLLRDIKPVDGNPFVFAKGDGKLPPEAMRVLLKRFHANTEAVPHGFRRTFTDWAGDMGYVTEIAEMATAHAVKGVRGRYRGMTAEQLRAQLMQNYADHAFGVKVFKPQLVSYSEAA